MKRSGGCSEELLLDMAEGELEPWQRLAVEQHLAGCAACQERLAGLRATLAWVDRGSDACASPAEAGGLLYRVRRHLRAEYGVGRRRRRTFAALGTAAAAALLVYARILGPVATPSVGPAAPAVVAALGGAADLADLIESYLLQTATTEELLAEVGTLHVDDELLAYTEEE